MAKVFLVTDGSYSDFHILGAFSTKELAENAAKLWGANQDIEEFEIDQTPQRCRDVPDGMFIFIISMKQDGTVDWHSFVNAEEKFDPGIPSVFAGRLRMHVIARDLEHAVKIVNEKRTQLIAENLWIDPTQQGILGVMNAMRGAEVVIKKEDLLRDGLRGDQQ